MVVVVDDGDDSFACGVGVAFGFSDSVVEGVASPSVDTQSNPGVPQRNKTLPGVDVVSLALVLLIGHGFEEARNEKVRVIFIIGRGDHRAHEALDHSRIQRYRSVLKLPVKIRTKVHVQHSHLAQHFVGHDRVRSAEIHFLEELIEGRWLNSHRTSRCALSRVQLES